MPGTPSPQILHSTTLPPAPEGLRPGTPERTSEAGDVTERTTRNSTPVSPELVINGP